MRHAVSDSVNDSPPSLQAEILRMPRRKSRLSAMYETKSHEEAESMAGFYQRSARYAYKQIEKYRNKRIPMIHKIIFWQRTARVEYRQARLELSKIIGDIDMENPL